MPGRGDYLRSDEENDEYYRKENLLYEIDVMKKDIDQLNKTIAELKKSHEEWNKKFDHLIKISTKE